MFGKTSTAGSLYGRGYERMQKGITRGWVSHKLSSRGAHP